MNYALLTVVCGINNVSKSKSHCISPCEYGIIGMTDRIINKNIMLMKASGEKCL